MGSTETFSTLTTEADSDAAGRELGRAIRQAFFGAVPDVVIVFASARHDYPRLLQALAETAGTDRIIGASSAGEFSQTARGEGAVSVLALRSAAMRFAIGAATALSQSPQAAADRVVASFSGVGRQSLPHRSALVMTDALAGHADHLVEALTLATGGNYRFFGGGAGDDGQFHKTHVFAGTEALNDAVVALEILSDQPLGIGVSHGWVPASEGFRVTEAEGMQLVSLNGMPALEAFQMHAEATGQRFDPSDPLPFFLHNILGIHSPGDQYRLRVPLGVNAEGVVACAAEIPTGSIVHIMQTNEASALKAAERATRSALEAMAGHPPAAALFFDCVATRMRLGKAFEDELQVCAQLLQPAGFAGCNTYGQIARAEGQFGGFHNCTAVVCVLPA